MRSPTVYEMDRHAEKIAIFAVFALGALAQQYTLLAAIASTVILLVLAAIFITSDRREKTRQDQRAGDTYLSTVAREYGAEK